MLFSVIAYSQGYYLTETQKDSAVYKIIRGNKAIEQNKVFKIQIKNRDSIITLQHDLYDTADNTIGTLKLVKDNLEEVIVQKDEIISNNKKIARKRSKMSIVKGVGIGIIAGFFLFR